ncbi:DnaJ C-terminal domain-containing protein [Brevundimonas balnearis]|uniref:DnaJ C-terminal domain-containing protein n=1 Tax=Brevundimonas balnearis TaxID=1572858 RepID=A0ABV6QYU4_9CAUL
MTLKDARARLGLVDAAGRDAIGPAFRKAAKAAVLLGDDAALRAAIVARDLLLTDAPPLVLSGPKAPAPKPPTLGLTPRQALSGGVIETRLPDGRRVRILAPPGVRTGDSIRLRGAGPSGEDLYLPAVIRSGDGLTVVGDDVYMSAPCPPRVLEEGGRIEIETHAGVRDAWVARGLKEPVRLCLRGLGLPARGSRPAGRLYVRLEPEAGAPSAAEDLLARFHRVWTSERLAA